MPGQCQDASSSCLANCPVKQLCIWDTVLTIAGLPRDATAGVCPMDGSVCVRNLHGKGGCLNDWQCQTYAAIQQSAHAY